MTTRLRGPALVAAAAVMMAAGGSPMPSRGPRDWKDSKQREDRGATKIPAAEAKRQRRKSRNLRLSRGGETAEEAK